MSLQVNDKMEGYEIIGIHLIPYGEHIRFGGFKLRGVCGEVDPFVDANLEVTELKKYENDDGEIHDVAGFFEAEKRWAREQVGKTLRCERLSYCAFATCGAVTFAN